jgi:maleylpyruvate isomerase
MEAAGRAALAVADLRRRKVAATQRLLGDTIAISDADWRQSTALPGWTRAHIASHLARNADATRRALEDHLDGRDHVPAPTGVLAIRELETGSRRSPLDLQIDLDTSAGRLNSAFDRVEEGAWESRIIGADLALGDLLLARYNEVVLHHIDLDCGYGFSDLDPVAADVLLGWNVRRLGASRLGRTSVELVTETGNRLLAGEPERPPVRVTGTAAALLGWLTGRLDRRSVDGAEHLSLGRPA